MTAVAEVALVVPIVVYGGYTQTTGRAKHVQWAELARRLSTHQERAVKESGQVWSPVVFKSKQNRRANESIAELTAAVLDLDHATPHWGLLDGVEYAAHTTHSHAPGDPRWRLVLPFAEVCPADQWADVWPRLRAAFAPEADESAKDVSRAYLWPACRPGAERLVKRGNGTLLNWRSLPAVAPDRASFQPAAAHEYHGERPGDLLGRETDWATILLPAGWILVATLSTGERRWRCPWSSKQRGHCATTGYSAADTLHIFCGATGQPLAGGQHHTKFHAFTTLEHQGDYQAAARALASRFGAAAAPRQAARNGVAAVHLSTDSAKSDSGAESDAPDPPLGPPSERLVDEIAQIPVLPPSAALTPEMVVAAARVRGWWLDPYISAFSALSPRSSRSLLETCALFALNATIARRAYLQVGAKRVFSALFSIFVGRSTLVAKTTALELLKDLFALADLLDLLLPSSFTPQALLSDLALGVPAYVRDGSPLEQSRWLARHRHGAQRGIIRDEVADLFGDATRDYMAGLLGLFLKLDGSPDRLDSEMTISRGWIEVENVCVSAIGATTPAALREHASNTGLWANGLLGRFTLIAPEEPPRWAFWPREALAIPADLVDRLRRLYTALPVPQAEFLYGQPSEKKRSERGKARAASTLLPAQEEEEKGPIIGARQLRYRPIAVEMTGEAWGAFERYDRALFTMAAEAETNERLDPSYGRLPGLAGRVAVALATSEWAFQDEAARPAQPVLALGHWAAAQEMTERWRQSAHRILAAALRSEDATSRNRDLERVLRLLARAKEPVNRGDVLQPLKLRSTELDALIEASGGQIVETTGESTGGRKPRFLELAELPVSAPTAPATNGQDAMGEVGRWETL